MTSVYPRTDPARVLQVAATAPHEVPLLLAELDNHAVEQVERLAEAVGRYAREVMMHRKIREWWIDAGAQLPVTEMPWTGAEPVWPTDEPRVPAPLFDDTAAGVPPGDADRTQFIPAETIAAAMTGIPDSTGAEPPPVEGPTVTDLEPAPVLSYPQPPPDEDWSARRDHTPDRHTA